MSTVYSIIDRSYNYDFRNGLSSSIADKLELAGVNRLFALRASVHLASMNDLSFSLLQQIEQFKITDDMPTVASRAIVIWELALSLKFHADIFRKQAEEINEFLLDADENEDESNGHGVGFPPQDNRIRTNQWFKDRYCVIERAVSNYTPRLIAVRWTYNLLELGSELFNLVDKLDVLLAKSTRRPEDIMRLWLEVSFDWTQAGEGALIHLGNHTATGLDRVDPGLIGWSIVLIEEMRIEGLSFT